MSVTCLVSYRKVSELFLIKDMTVIPNYVWFEYTAARHETRLATKYEVRLHGDHYAQVLFLYPSPCRNILKRKSG